MRLLCAAVFVCLLLVPLAVNAGEWVDTDKTNCKIWNQAPAPNQTISWSGDCLSGYAPGSGTAICYENSKEIARYEGQIKSGKFHGKGTFTCGNGKQFTGNFENGKPVGFAIQCVDGTHPEKLGTTIC